MAALRASMASKNYAVLLCQVHKLHGAVCYCDMPALRGILAKLERALNSEIEKVQDLFLMLEQEFLKTQHPQL